MKKLLQSALVALPLIGIFAINAEARCTQWSVNGNF